MAKIEPQENNISYQGTNIENTELISKEARDFIQKNQEALRKELKSKIPKVTVSEQLANTPLTSLDLSKIQIPYGVDLSGVTVKDVIDPTKFDMAKDDLSGLTEEHLDMKLLISIGFSAFSFAAFSALAIMGLIKSIKNKVKQIDVETKQKIINSNQDNTTTTLGAPPTSVDKTSTTQTNIAGDNTTQYNKMDGYSKKRNNMKRKVNNSPYTIDKRQRSDVLGSTKAVSTKKSTLILKNNPNYGKYFNSFNV